MKRRCGFAIRLLREGFAQSSGEYPEDGILHIHMTREFE